MEIGTFRWDWRACVSHTAGLAIVAICFAPVTVARHTLGSALGYWQWAGICALLYVGVRLMIAFECWATGQPVRSLGFAREAKLLVLWAIVTHTTAEQLPARPSDTPWHFQWPLDLLTVLGIPALFLLFGIRSEPRRHRPRAAQG